MKKYGYLFPGQGAQQTGMGREIFESSPRARAVFEKANRILGYDLAKICFEGPESELTKTNISQPAIFTASIAALEALREKAGTDELPASVTAGLSLGEYTALVFAGALAFEDGLKIVHLRGTYMQKACDERPGAMASIIGLSAKEVEQVVEEVRGNGILTAANYNSNEQIAISGEVELVKKAADAAKAKGAKRAMVLNVAGAFHSRLMDSAAESLIPHIKAANVRPPRVPFYANVTGEIASDPKEIRANLIKQVNNPVRWAQTMEKILSAGNREFLEVGPGNVLAGLLKRTAPDAKVAGILLKSQIEAVATGAQA
jgi:[acyl-carrier-protein] S-malonyltransferase